MGVKFNYVDYDKLYLKYRSSAIILNEIDTHTQEGFDRLLTLLTRSYQTDRFNALYPTCNCGKMFGNFAKGQYHKDCLSYVTDQSYEDIKPLTWFEKLDNDHPFMSISVFTDLFDQLTKTFRGSDSFYILEYLLNPSYKYHTKQEKTQAIVYNITNLIKTQVTNVRGYANFYHNFDSIMVSLITALYPNDVAYDEIPPSFPLKHIYLNILSCGGKEAIFSNHIPLPSRIWLNRETSVYSTVYVNGGVKEIIGLVRSISMMYEYEEWGDKKPNKAAINRNTYKILATLHSFYNDKSNKANLINTHVGSKEGLVRKQILGTRSPFTFRFVISSQTDAQDYETIQVPWVTLLVVFKAFVMGNLKRRGYGFREANEKIIKARNKFDPEIHDIGISLIKDYQNKGLKGIPVVDDRNPTMDLGSVNIKYINEFKINIMDKTINYPTLAVYGPNADFDGDELNFMFITDMNMYRKLLFLRYAGCITKVGEEGICGNLGFPKTAAEIMINYLKDKSD